MSLGMDVIQQSPFMPLTKALYEAIKTMNECDELATQESIGKFLRQNYQDVHIPSMNIIYDCLGLLIKERMVYHTGNGYYINNHRTTKTTDTNNHTDNTGEKEKETAKPKPDKESSGSSKHSKHEKPNLKNGQKPSRQTKLLKNANEKALDKLPRKTVEVSVVPSDNRTQRETDARQVSDDCKMHDSPPRLFISENPEEESKKRTDWVQDTNDNAFPPGDGGRIKRGLFERMSGRKSKTEKEKMNQEDSKGSKEKKNVLNQLACLIKNKSFTSSTTTESSASSTTSSTPSNIVQTCDQLNQTRSSYDENNSSRNEETLVRNILEHKQQDRPVVVDKNIEVKEKERPVFTRSQSLVTSSRTGRQNQFARSNSYANSKPNQETERLTASKVESTNFSNTRKFVSATNKGPCAVGIVRPLSLESNIKPILGRPHSASSSGRSISFREKVRPRSIPFPIELSGDTIGKLSNDSQELRRSKSFVSTHRERKAVDEKVVLAMDTNFRHRLPNENRELGRSKSFVSTQRERSAVAEKAAFAMDTNFRHRLPNENRELGRSKSFVSTQRERNAVAEKAALAMDTNFRHSLLSHQNSNAYSKSRVSTRAPRVRSPAAPIKNIYEHAPNLPPKKICPFLTTPKKTSLVDIDSSVTAWRNVGDRHSTSPICNDRCRINDMKLLDCQGHEFEDESGSENSSKLNHILWDPFNHVLQSDINHLVEDPESLDICLDDVSSTSESVFSAEMRLEEKQFVFDYSQPNAGVLAQTQQCNSHQFPPEEAKTNSSLTFIGII